MSEHLILAPLLRVVLRRGLTKQRNPTSATLATYREALRMAILCATARLQKKAAALDLEDLDRDLVLAFLDEPEENSVATPKARLAAIPVHHVIAADPASFGVAQGVLTIPTKREHSDALPNQRRSYLATLTGVDCKCEFYDKPTPQLQG